MSEKQTINAPDLFFIKSKENNSHISTEMTLTSDVEIAIDDVIEAPSADASAKCKVFARYREIGDVFCRDETIMKLGNSQDTPWNLICNIFLLNPGSAYIYTNEENKPLNYTQYLIGRGVGAYTDIDRNDKFFQFEPDPTMCIISKMFEGKNGVVKIHNLFNIRNKSCAKKDLDYLASLITELSPSERLVVLTDPDKFNFGMKEVIFAYGKDAVEYEDIKERIKNIVTNAKNQGLEVLRYHNTSFSDRECAISELGNEITDVNHISQMVYNLKPWKIKSKNITINSPIKPEACRK